jgi:hypothetical protein
MATRTTRSTQRKHDRRKQELKGMLERSGVPIAAITWTECGLRAGDQQVLIIRTGDARWEFIITSVVWELGVPNSDLLLIEELIKEAQL